MTRDLLRKPNRRLTMTTKRTLRAVAALSALSLLPACDGGDRAPAEPEPTLAVPEPTLAVPDPTPQKPEPTPQKPAGAAPEVVESFEVARAEFQANARLQGDVEGGYLDALRDAHRELTERGLAHEAQVVTETYDLATGKLRLPPQ